MSDHLRGDARWSSQVNRRTSPFNPWSIVNLVFHHIWPSRGLHPLLGSAGDPGEPAAQLLMALGITPAPEGNRQDSEDVRQRLADIRAAMFGES